MNELSIKQIYSINREYDERKEELLNLLNELNELNSLIDIDEVEENLDYDEMKDLMNLIGYRIKDKYIKDRLNEIMKNKKVEKYPELLGVHFFKELKEIDFLNENEKIKLDQILKMASDKPSKRYLIRELDNKVIEWLISNKVITRIYSFSCKCENSSECGKEYMTEEEKNKFYKFHDFDYINSTEEEKEKHIEKFEEGYFQVGCYNGNGYEVCTIKDFENNINKKVSYKVIKQPNLIL